MGFKRATAVKPLTGELVKKLGDQGWAKEGADLTTPKSVILRRTRGEAMLTIFVKSADAGSQVTIMSQGLSWDE
jgi:hypothetical protein